MEIGIIGLPQSGKTTVFNALTKGKASVAGYSGKPNIGVAKVPDERIDNLAELYQPRKVVPAEVTYTDVPPPPDGFGETRGIGGEYLNDLQNSEALPAQECYYMVLKHCFGKYETSSVSLQLFQVSSYLGH